jgi:hypothetical protein
MITENEQEGELTEMVVRAMIRREYDEESGGSRPPVFETVTTGASITIGADGAVSQTILGYAEVPPRSHIGRHEEFRAFYETAEAIAGYVHWKPIVNPPTSG